MCVNVPTGDESTELKKVEEIDPRCIVKFRPADDWEGEYGFDWFREGDYGEVFIDGSIGGTKSLSWYEPFEEGTQQETIALEIKSESDYKNDNLVGKYGSNKGVVLVYDEKGRLLSVHPNNHFRTKGTVHNVPNYKNARGNYVVFSKDSANPQYYKATEIDGRDWPTLGIFEYDSQQHIMIDINNNNQTQVVNSTIITNGPYPIDPDYCKYFHFRFADYEFEQRDEDDNTVDSEKLGKKYFFLNIKGEENKPYYVPYISLFCLGRNKDLLSALMEDIMKVNALYDSRSEELGIWKAKVKLLITAKNVDRIRFYCDETVKCEPQEIMIDKNCTSKKTVVISNLSKCIPTKKEFSFVTVKAAQGKNDPNPTIAGRICVVKYPPKKVDVVFVPLLSRINKGFVLPILKWPIDINHPIDSITENNDLRKEEDFLKRYLSQFQVVPSVVVRRIRKKGLLKKIDILIQAATKGGKVSTKTEQDGIHYEDGTEVAKGTDLHVVFEDIFEKDLEENEGHLKNAFKVFYILAEGSDCMGQTGGNPKKVTNPPKNVIVFNHKGYSMTICHELLHSFGLFHSFSNSSPFTFQKWRTSNIMDYPVALKLQTSWKWQWDELQKFKELEDVENPNPYRVIDER